MNWLIDFIGTLPPMQRGGHLQYGWHHIWPESGGSATRLDPAVAQDVHQQKSGTGDRQLAGRRGGEGEGSSLNTDFESWIELVCKDLHVTNKLLHGLLTVKYWGRGGGRFGLRLGGHGASHPGCSHRWKFGCTHQSRRDLPSKKRGEKIVKQRTAPAMFRESDVEVLLGLFQGVTHQQWYLFNDFLIEPIDKVNIWLNLF